MIDGLGTLDDAGGYQGIWLDSPLVIVRLTLSGEIAALNPAGQRFLALTQADYGCLLTQFVHPIDRNALVKMIEQVVAEESPRERNSGLENPMEPSSLVASASRSSRMRWRLAWW